MALKPSELAQAMEAGFAVAWSELKPGEAFPQGGAKDRELLFRAIARGILTYLDGRPDDAIGSVRLTPQGGSTYSVDHLDWTVDLSQVP